LHEDSIQLLSTIYVVMLDYHQDESVDVPKGNQIERTARKKNVTYMCECW